MTETAATESAFDPTSTDAMVLRGIAVEIARTAADHVRRRRPEVFDPSGFSGDSVRAKSTPTDPVTVVDTETEELVRSMLVRMRPDDDVLGEEEGGDEKPPEGVRWVVDPIDGTVNFLYGIPAYSVSIAAQIDGVSVAGAVVDVVGRRTYAAHRGGGAATTVDTEDGDEVWTPLRCNTIDAMSMALTATGFGYDAARRTEQGRIIGALLPLVRDVRRIGSAALDLCMVAAGAVDAHFEHGLSPWDWAAGSLIAEEAGAVVIVPSPQSRSDDGEVTFASAPGIAAEFRSVLTGLGGMDPLPK